MAAGFFVCAERKRDWASYQAASYRRAMRAYYYSRMC
jgi:hypothetical protein